MSAAKPTEPGFYWYRETPGHAWSILEVFFDEGDKCLSIKDGGFGANYIENYPGDYVGPIPEPCECVNWCRDGLDTPPEDPRHAVFGRLMWGLILKFGEDFFTDQWSEYVLPIAQNAGLCKRVKYDPEKHGAINADPGDLIWFWGEEAGE